MLISQAHSFAQQARLAIALAWVAGFTNILTWLSCGTVTSHVSGSVAQWALDLAEARLGLLGFTTFLLATFIFGAMLAAVCTETGRRRGWESLYVLPLTLQALLLATFAVIFATLGADAPTGATLWCLVGLASIAMGLQNATITRISGGVVRTTHMTGIFTDLGLESVLFLYWLRDRRTPPIHPRETPPPGDGLTVLNHPTGRRLALLASIVASFATGSGLGAIAYAHVPQWAMVLPVSFLLALTIHDLRVPVCEIEPSPREATESLNIPPGLAIYHLRRDLHRKGPAHRLPDLLRWAERLPLDCRIVILDFDVSAPFNANTALELRALVRQFESRDLRLIISGMNPQQYRGLRSAGAADALDASNVCPDLDLAIARGIMLSQDA